MNYSDGDAGRIEACPHCAAGVTLPSSTNVVVATLQIRRGGAGRAVKFVGVLIFIASFLWCLLLVSTVLTNRTTANALAVAAFASIPSVLGMILGAALVALSRRIGVHFVCSNCGMPMTGNGAVCAKCGATFATATV
jgi:hypothetical protein